MTHTHDHGDGHVHTHPHSDGSAGHDVPAVLDESVPDSELSPSEVGRRAFLRSAGVLGAGAAAGGSVLAQAGSAAAAPPAPSPRGGYLWLAGDHHIHTQYSSDAQYRVVDQVQHAEAFGLDWMVITDHGGATHARIGVDLVNPDIVEARAAFEDRMLVFQGLEWNIPAADHGTVFVHPGSNEVAVLKEFENSFDGSVNGWGANTAANELHALEGLDFLAASITSRRIDDALMLANHPSRGGVDSPHEFRGWRERRPGVAVGMEGAPGHQAAGIPAPYGPGSARGYYGNSAGPNSFPGYPPESYATWGGFDWITATVGGLWDSLLAEGRPWWISANSDSHVNWLETSVRGPNSDFNANGRYEDPVHGGVPNATAGDFWPGYYSRTHVGSRRYGYAGVMEGLRAGRVWVDHGNLLDSLDVSVRRPGRRQDASPLGSVRSARRGDLLELAITFETASLPNWAQFVPELARIDVIRGAVTGNAADRDTFSAPSTRVVQSFDVSGQAGVVELRYDLGRVEEPFYVRLRGTDGKRSQVGINGASVDPAGPAVDVLGNADPWEDLWFYTNPIWVLPQA